MPSENCQHKNMANMTEHENPTRIDWFRVFVELKVTGWSVNRIEREMDFAKSTMLGWKAGAEPRHADGETLINLWRVATGKERENLPIEQRFANAYSRK